MKQPTKCPSRKTVRLHVRKSDGQVAFMYDEQAVQAMTDAGHRPEIHRMSQVHFNNATQQWEARDNSGEIIATADTYAKCVAQEVLVLDSRPLTEI